MSEYLQLCHKTDGKVDKKWLMSEKLDGQRAWWDGGITRGILKKHVPWANVTKDARYLTEQRATGLWSRLGNVIHAPDWWLDQLPNIMLDGELFMGYMYRQELMTQIKGNAPSFRCVKYFIYDVPPCDTMLAGRTVGVGGGRKITIPPSHAWRQEHAVRDTIVIGGGMRFEDRIEVYNRMGNDVIVPHKQLEVGNDLETYLADVLARGGEGLVIRDPRSLYATVRSHSCLKYKPFDDSEGTVVGWVSGEATDKGSRLLGMMGSLILRLDNGQRLHLSGFTDEERQLHDPSWAKMNPGSIGPSPGPVHFSYGQCVSFKYRGLTADGIPMEARYWRKRVDE